MNFQPLNSNILIELVKQDEQTAGGLLLPDSARETQNQGKVLAVGEGIQDRSGNFQKLPVSVGDVLVYNKTAGVEMEVEGKKCKVIAIRDVLGKVVEQMSSKGLTLATMLTILFIVAMVIISEKTSLFHFSTISFLSGVFVSYIWFLVNKFLKEEEQ